MKKFQTLTVTCEEKMKIKQSMAGCPLRNHGRAYKKEQEKEILKVFYTFSLQEQAQFAHLVIQAMGDDPEWYPFFHVTDQEIQMFSNMPKTPTILGNIAFMALYGPPMHRWRFRRLLHKQRSMIPWGIFLFCYVMWLMTNGIPWTK